MLCCCSRWKIHEWQIGQLLSDKHAQILFSLRPARLGCTCIRHLLCNIRLIPGGGIRSDLRKVIKEPTVDRSLRRRDCPSNLDLRAWRWWVVMRVFIWLSSQLINQLCIIPRMGMGRRLRAKQSHQIIQLLLQSPCLRGLACILPSMERRWPTFFIQPLAPAITVRRPYWRKWPPSSRGDSNVLTYIIS